MANNNPPAATSQLHSLIISSTFMEVPVQNEPVPKSVIDAANNKRSRCQSVRPCRTL